MTDDQPNILRMLGPVRRQWMLFLIFGVALTAGAWIYSTLQEKQYSATATLYFRDAHIDQTLFGSQFFTPATDAARASATNRDLVALPIVATMASRSLSGMRPNKVAAALDVQEQGAADLVGVTATDPSPVLAARIANAVAFSYIAYRRGRDQSKVHQAQSLLDKQVRSLPEGQKDTTFGIALRKRAEDLRVLGALQTGNAEVAQRATVPSSPSSPQTKRNVVIGLFAGLLLAYFVAVLRERSDRYVRAPEEVSELLGQPVLAIVPEDKDLTNARLDSLDRLPGGAAETFRILRANLRYVRLRNGANTVVVTSADASDGKTTVAWNLAAAAAEVGMNVLLIEADLRKPTIATRSAALLDGHAPSQGLSGVLSGQGTLRDNTLKLAIGAKGVRLDVLPAGPVPPNPTDLLDSPEMDVLLNSVADYGLVVIDSAPILVVADAIPLLGRVGGVLAVVRVGRTTKKSVASLRLAFETVDAPTVGFVANGASTASTSYYYSSYHTPQPLASEESGGDEEVHVPVSTQSG